MPDLSVARPIIVVVRRIFGIGGEIP